MRLICSVASSFWGKVLLTPKEEVCLAFVVFGLVGVVGVVMGFLGFEEHRLSLLAINGFMWVTYLSWAKWI